MARRIRDAVLESREARGKLKPRAKPYWRAIDRGLHLGYRKLKGRSGSWCIRLYLGNQKYAIEALAVADDLSDADSVKILDYWQAQSKAREKASALGRNVPHGGPLLVKDAMSAYVAWMRENRKSAADTERKIAVLINPVLGDLVCSTLSSDQIRAWHSSLAATPARKRTKAGTAQQFRQHSPDDVESVRKRRATANRVLTILKAALNAAWREEHIADDKAWRRVKPFENVDSARVRYLSIPEINRLLLASESQFRDLVQAAVQTGARYGELIRLRIGDFNPDTGRLAIRVSKSGKSRHVVLSEEGCIFFAALCAGKSPDYLMFNHGAREWRASEQVREMRKACERAGIVSANFHVLRHTWASHAVMNGLPLLLVAKNLGHSDTRMVEKHYGHLDETYMEEAIRASAPRFGTAVKGRS